VLCASIQAMGLGHNLDMASAIIVNGLPWDFARFDQAINRAKSPPSHGGGYKIRDFIDGDAQVLCASIQAMNLGHNLDVASAVIINGLPWDFARFDQAINRARSPPSHGGGYKSSASRRWLQKLRLLTAAATKAPPSHGGGYKSSAFSRRRLQNPPHHVARAGRCLCRPGRLQRTHE